MFCSQGVTVQTICVLFTGGDGSDQMCSVHRGQLFRSDVFCSQGVTVQTRCVLFTGCDGSDHMCSVHRG